MQTRNVTSRTDRSPAAASLAIIGLVLTCGGCGGDDGPARVAVQGRVTFDDHPLESGSILFVPAADTRGPKAGGRIHDGEYRLPRTEGPVIGRMRVEIRADQDLGYDPTEPEQTVLHASEPLPPNPVPPVYNDDSTLSVETTPDGPNSFEFHLQSGEPAGTARF